MTPDVISSYFPYEHEMFDLLIIDEGSQMLIENSMPAILRSKKLIVAGDSKQLQPQTLFKKTIDDELADAENQKSILDLSSLRSKSIMLNYHYRSRYEELINFSNHAFYNGKIVVSPNTNNDHKPIETIEVKNAIFSKSNAKEAQAVVEKLHELMVIDNRKSFAIITMNQEQQKLIEDLIERKKEVDSHFNRLWTEDFTKEKDHNYNGLLIKNVGNIQGEERDICLISYVYCENENGKVVNQFGDLSQANGEFKLNVAITRAKEKIYVFHSITPQRWGDFSTSVNPGPRLLVSYLKYAMLISEGNKTQANNLLKTLNASNNSTQEVLHFDSPFEAEVYETLTSKLTDCEVFTQVGVSGYKIDLGIKYKNNFILGIELDGQAYHSTKQARDRDYYRQKYLENRGWTIQRVWSTNYFKNKEAEIAKILQKIAEVKTKYR